MEKIQLTNNVSIGEGCRPVIVAEIGLNHNGNLDTALKMIQRAKNIGVDAVKFQVKDVEEAHPTEMLDMPYQGPNSFGKTYREHKQALEFSQNDSREKITRDLNIWLEKRILKNPKEWIWSHNRWK